MSARTIQGTWIYIINGRGDKNALFILRIQERGRRADNPRVWAEIFDGAKPPKGWVAIKTVQAYSVPPGQTLWVRRFKDTTWISVE